MVTLNLSAALGGNLKKLQTALDNPTPLLEAWGKMGVAASGKAFVDQKFGEDAWPERYPGQADPKLNVAGALSDFNAGRAKPKPNRFQDRPALVDEGFRGGLWGSISYQTTSSDTVEWGTVKPYGTTMQYGGKTVIRLSQSAVDRARAWLFTPTGKTRKGRDGYAEKLWHALRTKIHSQSVLPRPFVGIHDELKSDMLKAGELFLQKTQEGKK